MASLHCINLEQGLRINTNGECTSCCLQTVNYKNENNETLNIRKNTFDEIINSSSAKQIRENLKQGKRDINCRQCWSLEDAGLQSKRLLDNHHRAGEGLLLDLCMGTTCNIKCRTCGPESSAQWNKEYWDINKSYNEISTYKDYKGFLKTFNDAFDEDSLVWKELENNKKDIRWIDMYGGEPMMMKKQWKFLEQLIEDNLAKNISLHYNTNGTIWDDEKYNILKEFKHISIDFSIDGIKDRYEFMRHPAVWEEVIQNMETIKNIKDFKCQIAHTVSTLNVWYINEIYMWFKGWDIYLNMVHGPPEYNISNIPEDIKKVITEKIGIKEKYQPVLDFMNSKISNFNFQSFIDKTKQHDNYRGENYNAVFPEFSDVLKEHGYQ